MSRQGLGKLRRVDAHHRWVQETAGRGELEYRKVKGIENGADLFRKALMWEEIRGHLGRIGAQVLEEPEGAHEVPHIGAKPVGVQVERVLHHLGFSSVFGPRAGARTGLQSATTRTTLRCGPSWGAVVARTTSRASDGQSILVERPRILLWHESTASREARSICKRPWCARRPTQRGTTQIGAPSCDHDGDIGFLTKSGARRSHFKSFSSESGP